MEFKSQLLMRNMKVMNMKFRAILITRKVSGYQRAKNLSEDNY